jgi:hypothetical protein
MEQITAVGYRFCSFNAGLISTNRGGVFSSFRAMALSLHW